ncbi:MAG: hypothetical protein ACTH6N_04625 [Brachybacterium tyrofermentans]|uniref:hypothetical protein n=1 Tax=Brachybacterium tyrofermentans TaxID=47848 RepID=UPI00186822BD|nr:hypothetical protein [Brachybacterium tyrofermentans]
MAYESRQWADGELVTAEDLTRIEQGLQATSELAEGTATRVDGVETDLAATTAAGASTAATVDNIKLANVSAGEGAPAGAAPVGWRYIDLATGDHYRMEA